MDRGGRTTKHISYAREGFFIAGAIPRLPRKRYRFHIVRETSLIEQLTDTLPDDEVFKLISAGGFSSIGFVRFVADRTHIKTLTALSATRNYMIFMRAHSASCLEVHRSEQGA